MMGWKYIADGVRQLVVEEGTCLCGCGGELLATGWRYGHREGLLGHLEVMERTEETVLVFVGPPGTRLNTDLAVSRVHYSASEAWRAVANGTWATVGATLADPTRPHDQPESWVAIVYQPRCSTCSWRGVHTSVMTRAQAELDGHLVTNAHAARVVQTETTRRPTVAYIDTPLFPEETK